MASIQHYYLKDGTKRWRFQVLAGINPQTGKKSTKSLSIHFLQMACR